MGRVIQGNGSLISHLFRKFLTPPNVIGQPMQWIYFDAFKMAFGTCVYLRWKVNNDKYEVRFVTDKSRAAPFKEVTQT